jgi:hypothetical protein
MALQAAQHEAVHNKTGSDLDRLKAKFDEGVHSTLVIDNPDDNPVLTSILYQMQKMQDEINYLRGIIDANNDKVSMTVGTSSTTALAGDTTTISTAQANEITASTTLGSKLNVVTRVADANKSTAITFGEFTTTVSGKTTTYSLPITVVETDTSGKSPVTTTKTGSITLT